MFSRLTSRAGRVLVLAQEEARARGAGRLEPAHVLLGARTDPSAGLLDALGLDRRTLVAGLEGTRGGVDGGTEAEPHRGPLATIGIDLDEVRRAVDASFGPGSLDRVMARRRPRPGGHIRFAAATRDGLAWAVREAADLGERRIDTDLLSLGMLAVDPRPLAGTGRGLADARALVRRRPGAA